MRDTLKLFRNHIVTGFIFLMPGLLVIVVIGKFWDKLLALGNKLSRLFNLDTVLGATGDAIIAILLLLFLCIIAGYLVKISVLRSFSDWIDLRVGMFIPGYTDLKSKTQQKVTKHKIVKHSYESCFVKLGEYWRPAYLIEIAANGNATIFIPQAPVYTSGDVVIVPPGGYKKLDFDSIAMNTFLKNFGKGLPIMQL